MQLESLIATWAVKEFAQLLDWMPGPEVAHGTLLSNSAPDNTGGHVVDPAVPVVLDNFAIIDPDLDGDRLPDFGVSVKSRTTFHVALPLPVRSTSWGALKSLYQSR